MSSHSFEETIERLRGISGIPGLLFADDAPSYVLGTMMASLSASRLETAYYLEGSLNPYWDTTTALNELVGTIEAVILISKWAQHPAPPKHPSMRALDAWNFGLVTLSLTNSAYCLEKSLKTLQAIERPTVAPKRDHSLRDMWSQLSVSVRHEVEEERDALPPSWQSTLESRRTIDQLLDVSDSLFVWGRYAPEIRRGTTRMIPDPLELMQVAAAIQLVCLRWPGVATPLRGRAFGETSESPL